MIPDQPNSKPRVLVIEDEPRMRELLCDVVPDMGFAAEAVRSAEEALRLMEGDPREIVVVDLNLPGMDGMEFFAAVHERWPQTQVIILTGFGDLESARQAIRLDVVDFLTKPCHLGELDVALSRARRRWRESLPLPEPAPEAAPEPPAPPAEGAQTLDDVERQHILSALERNHGNRTATAVELGISRRTLHYRLSEYARQGFLRE